MALTPPTQPADPEQHRQTLQALRAQLYAMPKIDLHRHLEGSLRLETLAEIAMEHGIDLPSYDIESLRPYVQVTEDYQPGFHRFLEKFKLLRRFYTTREAVQRIAYEAVADAAADNIKYLELRYNPAALAEAKSFRYADVMEWVWLGVQRAQAEHAIQARLIVSVIRQEAHKSADIIEAVLSQPAANGIVAIDVSGDEVNYPLTPFVPLFQRARQVGLHVTVHAGEAGNALKVKEAIELLDAERIGHGVRCIENSEIVQLVRERKVTLEVCPTSNLQTGVMRLWGHHPLPDLYRLGLRVTVNTDDPSISSTTLTDEYYVVLTTMQLRVEDLKRMLINSAQAVFLPEQERAALEAQFRAELELDGSG